MVQLHNIFRGAPPENLTNNAGAPRNISGCAPPESQTNYVGDERYVVDLFKQKSASVTPSFDIKRDVYYQQGEFY